MMYLDTHREIKNLIDKGFQESQAEAITSLVSRYNDQLATKRDVESVRSELKHDIEVLRTELKSEIKDVEVTLTRWIVPLLITIILAIIGMAVGLFIK